MTRRKQSRRAFLGVSAVTGLGAVSLGVSSSSSWAARFVVRARIAEVFQDVAPAPHKPNPGGWSDNAVTLATDTRFLSEEP